MDVSGALKSFRDGGYGGKDASSEPKEAAGPRTITLTDDEAKELAGYSGGEGAEQECLVTGRLSGSELTVTSVKSSGGGQDDMAKEVMDRMGGAGRLGSPAPMMQNQTMPSPS
jgi:hypothetical protein